MDSCYNENISIGNAFTVREITSETLLNSKKLDLHNIFTSKITEGEKNKILEKVFSYQLSPKIKQFAQDYQQIYGKRNDFLWKWLGVVYRDSGVALSTVDPNYLEKVTDTKIIFTMLFSILDDVSEFYKDEYLMEELLEIVCTNQIKNDTDNEQIIYFKKLWDHFNDEIKEFPRYKDFKEIFEYDLRQMVNSVRFSYLMNKKPEYINLQEMEFYGSFNMIVFLLNGIDLMASPDFDEKELPQIRTVFWNAQQMARIGNWLSTWKREIKEEDVSSGVFAYAFTKKILTVDDLKNMEEEEIIQKIEKSDMADYFADSWQNKFDNIKNLKTTIKSVDIEQYINGLEKLITLHLASEGYK